MAQTEAKITITAQDQTRLGIASATAGLKSLQATALSVARGFSLIGAGVAAAGFITLAKQGINAADEMGKLAQKTGIATAAMSTLSFAAKQSELSQDQLSTGLKKLSVSMFDAASGGKEAVKLFGQMGVSAVDMDGKLRATDSVLLELADRFKAMPDGAGKAALAVKLFGKAGIDLIPFLNEGSAGIQNLQNHARALGLEITDNAARAADKFNDDMANLSAASSGLAITLATNLLPALTSIASKMAEATRAGGFLKGVLAGIDEAVRQVKYGDELGQTTANIKKLQNDISVLSHDLERANKDQKNKASIGIIGRAFMGDPDAIKREMDKRRTLLKAELAHVELLNHNLKSPSGTSGPSATGGIDFSPVETGANKAADALKKYRTELTSLLDQLSPAEAESRKFHAAQDLLNTALSQGDIGASAYAIAMTRLTETMTPLGQANAEAIRAGNDLIAVQQSGLQTLIQENEQFGLNADALARLNVVKAEAALASINLANASQIEIDQHKKLVDIARESEAQTLILSAKKTTEEVGKIQQDEAKRTADSWRSSLTDALLRSAESGKGFFENLRDTLKNSFETLILRPRIEAILGSIPGLGAPGATGSGGQGGGGIGDLLSTGKALWSGAKSLFGFGTASATAVPQLALNGMASATSTLTSSIVPATNAMSGLASSIGAAVPYIAAAVAAFTIIKSLFAKKLVDTGIKGTYTFDEAFIGKRYEKYKSTLGGSSTKRKPLGDDLQNFIDTSFRALEKDVLTYGDILGLKSQELLEGFTVKFKVSLKKLKPEQAQKKIADEIKKIADQLAIRLIPQIDLLGNAGEKAADTLARTANSFAAVKLALNKFGLDDAKVFNGPGLTAAVAQFREQIIAAQIEALKPKGKIVGLMGAGAAAALENGERIQARATVEKAAQKTSLLMAKIAGASEKMQAALAPVAPVIDEAAVQAQAMQLALLDMRNKLVEAVGGLEAFNTKTQFFFENFYSAAEQFSTGMRLSGEAISTAFAKANLSIPKTNEGFKALVTALDLTSDAGRATFAALMDVAPAFATVTSAIKAAQDNIKAIQAAALDSKLDFQNRINAAGGESPLRALADNVVYLNTALNASKDPAQRIEILKRQADILGQITDARIAAINREKDAISANTDKLIDSLNTEKDRISELSEKRLEGLQRQLDLAQQWVGILDNARTMLNNLRLTGSNPLPVSGRLALAGGDVSRLKAQLAGATGQSRIDISGKLLSALDAQLQLGQEAYQRPSSEYQALYNSIVSQVTSLQNEAQTQASRAEVLQTEISALQEATVQQLKALDARIAAAGALAQQQLSGIDGRIAEANALAVAGYQQLQIQSAAQYALLEAEARGQLSAAQQALNQGAIQIGLLTQIRDQSTASVAVAAPVIQQALPVRQQQVDFAALVAEMRSKNQQQQTQQQRPPTQVFAPVININGNNTAPAQTKAAARQAFLEMLPLYRQQQLRG